MQWIRIMTMLKDILAFVLYVGISVGFVSACESDQKRNDAQNIEFSKGNY